jgi:hypothetical protein
MCRLAVLLFASAALAQAPAGRGSAGQAAPGQVAVGQLEYAKTGVVLAGRTIPWQSLASIEERDADAAAEYAAKKAADTAAAQFELGRWCREHALAEPAEKHFARALELDGKHEGALCALGRAPELVAARRAALPPMQFADWCRDRALPDEQWNVLVKALAKDAWDREAIARTKPIVQRRCCSTLLHPPFAGRWLGLVDASGHHQMKCFAFFAIDFVMVDAADRKFRGNGKANTDWFGFDQPIFAAADGEVTGVESRFDDNVVGKAAGFDDANYVEIRHAGDEETTYAHCRKGSVVVKVGDHVQRGDVIAHVGNSGASGMPHLHFTMDMSAWVGRDGVAIGRPWRLGGCRLVEANGTACAIELLAARPQEGWVLDCPSAPAR